MKSYRQGIKSCYFQKGFCIVNLSKPLPSQSAPVFENMGRFVTLKKMVQNMGCKKHGAKKQGHCYSNREEARLPILSLLVLKLV